MKPLTKRRREALEIIAEHEPVTVREFTKIMYGDEAAWGADKGAARFLYAMRGDGLLSTIKLDECEKCGRYRQSAFQITVKGCNALGVEP